MLDFSDVTNFQRRLIDASETSDIEDDWKRDTARSLADNIHPPQRTGALAASVDATDEGVEMLDYWQYPEYGTVHMAAQPFVRPAIQQEARPATDDLGKRVLRELT